LVEVCPVDSPPFGRGLGEGAKLDADKTLSLALSQRERVKRPESKERK
jgi:hypothetical protein